MKKAAECIKHFDMQHVFADFVWQRSSECPRDCRNRRKRKSLPSTSGWEGYPKLEDMQSQTSPPPPPPITPVKMNKPSLKTPPTKGSAKKKEALSHEECWSISQRLFKHFGTEAMPAKTMLNRYLRNRVGRPKQDVLMALEKEVSPSNHMHHTLKRSSNSEFLASCVFVRFLSFTTA